MSFTARGSGVAAATTPTSFTIPLVDGGGVLWLVVTVRGAVTVPVPTVTSPAATFTIAATVARPENDRRVSVFWCNDYETQTNMPVTVTPGGSPSAVIWGAAEQTGATVTADPVAQISAVAVTSSATPSTALVAGTGEMLVAACWGTSGTATPEAPGTELFDLASGTTAMAGYWATAVDLTPSMTLSGAASTGFIALETVTAVPVEPEVPEIPEPPIDTEGCETLEYTNPAGDSIRFVTLVEVTGRMMPPIAVTSIGVPAGHGASFRGAYHRERPVVTPVAAPGIFGERAELRRWARVLDPSKGEGTLTVVGGEWAGRRLRCVYEAGLDELAESSRSPLPASLIWRAAYPYWEDAVESSESVAQDAAIHNWFPFLPLVLGASDSFDAFSVSNEGDVVSWPVMTVTGPATDMEVVNVTTGQLWHVTGEVPAGATLTVDTRPGYKTVDVDGVNAFGRLTPESSLWGLAPGVNEVTVGGVLTTSATSINFTWRQAWLAA